MSGRWKPGDVARVRFSDVDEIALVRPRRQANGELEFAYRSGGFDMVDDNLIEDIRPLVVIDPEDREQVERLRDLMDRAWEEQNSDHGFIDIATGKGKRGNAMQAALRSLVTPPRIEEPGMWGVVEASCVHSEKRRTFVRGKRGWNGTDERSEPDPWEDLIDPVLVREGVEQ